MQPDAGLYAYLPNQGYVGKDRATVLVVIGGIKVKVEYFFQAIISGGLGYTGVVDRCGRNRGPYWKISTNLDDSGNSSITAVVGPAQLAGNVNPITDAAVLASWFRAAELHGSLANLGGINVRFASLPGGKVGQSSGNAITPDDNPAGHGWYIEPTPLNNTDAVVYVPHASQKKTQTTSQRDIDMVKARFAQLMRGET